MIDNNSNDSNEVEFNYVKSKYTRISKKLQDITNLYSELIRYCDIFKCKLGKDNMLDLKRRKQYYINQRTRVEHNISKIISNVNSSDEDDLDYEAKYCTDGNCHRFTRDVIDIDENTSQRITYCTLCVYTKK